MLIYYLQIFVQVVSESLPVSSSGHVKLISYMVSCLTRQQGGPLDASLMDLLHIPTALIIMIYFYPQWFFLLKYITRTWRICLSLIACAALADLITVFGYFVIGIQHVSIPLYVSFAITALVLVSVRFVPPALGVKKITIYDSCIIGLAQMMSLVQGISRFGSVYVVCRWLRFSAAHAFAITFMIEWPLIAAACLRSGVKNPLLFSDLLCYAPFIFLSSCISFVLFHWAYRLCVNEKIWWVGVYMIGPTVLAFLYCL